MIHKKEKLTAKSLSRREPEEKHVEENVKDMDRRVTRFKKAAPACGICYNQIEKQGCLDNCEHEFCFACIEKWSQTENTCPICKQRFSEIKSTWNRPFYGEVPRKKVHLSELDDKHRTLDVPDRSQNQASNDPFNTSLIGLLMEAFSQNAVVPFHRLLFSSDGDNGETYAIHLRLDDNQATQTDTLFITRLTSNPGE